MAETAKPSRNKAPAAEPGHEVEREEHPATHKPNVTLTLDDQFSLWLNKIQPVLHGINTAIMAKAASYNDSRHMIDVQRADRASLLSTLNAIIGKVEVNMVETADGADGQRYLSEGRILEAYREHFVEAGLHLLPNVVQTFPADQSGTVIVEVEFALADGDGRLWSPCCRVSGAGNDRVAHQRGGSGDKALARAMSAAYKEAICRLLHLPRGHDPERFNLAHEQPIAGVRPSNQANRPERQKPLTMAEEDDIRGRIIAKINDTSEMADLDNLLKHEKTKEYMARLGSRSRGLIERAEADQRRGLRIAEQRYQRTAPRDEHFDHRDADHGDIGDDVGGNTSYDENPYGDDRGDPDDDIPL